MSDTLEVDKVSGPIPRHVAMIKNLFQVLQSDISFQRRDPP